MGAKRALTAKTFLILPFLTACATAGGAGPQATTRPTDPEAAEIEALYRARTDSARMHYTQADIDFMTGMIHHHAQAVRISQLVPERTTTPAMRTLAARIINAQRDEIATMQRWLRDRGQAVPEVTADGRMAMEHHGGHAMHMPGMLSAEQIARLEAAQGAVFDSLFLTYMIAHHRGAVTMVHALFATDGAAQDEEVFKFASDVQVDQTTEVARMERMLAAMSDTGASP
jgi:uncharacterized protein (DUF305 family)